MLSSIIVIVISITCSQSLAKLFNPNVARIPGFRKFCSKNNEEDKRTLNLIGILNYCLSFIDIYNICSIIVVAAATDGFESLNVFDLCLCGAFASIVGMCN